MTLSACKEVGHVTVTESQVSWSFKNTIFSRLAGNKNKAGAYVAICGCARCNCGVFGRFCMYMMSTEKKKSLEMDQSRRKKTLEMFFIVLCRHCLEKFAKFFHVPHKKHRKSS